MSKTETVEELRAKLAASERHRAALELVLNEIVKFKIDHQSWPPAYAELSLAISFLSQVNSLAASALTNHSGALAAHDARVRAEVLRKAASESSCHPWGIPIVTCKELLKLAEQEAPAWPL